VVDAFFLILLARFLLDLIYFIAISTSFKIFASCLVTYIAFIGGSIPLGS
jgi:hypothetical protein